MRSITCDNCPTTVPIDQIDEAGWLHIGWVNGHIHDACSDVCGKAIIDQMVADENAGT